MTAKRDRADLLLDDERAPQVPDTLIDCLFEELNEIASVDDDLPASNTEAGELMRKCLRVWDHPAIQYRLRQLEREVWRRRLLFNPATNEALPIRTRRDSFIVKRSTTAATLNSKHNDVVPSLATEPGSYLLPVVTRSEVSRNLDNLPAGTVVLEDREPATGRIGWAHLTKGE